MTRLEGSTLILELGEDRIANNAARAFSRNIRKSNKKLADDILKAIKDAEPDDDSEGPAVSIPRPFPDLK